MPPFTQSQWLRFRRELLSQFKSECGKRRIKYLRELPYFFEDWLTGECACVAKSTFTKIEISKNNKMFKGISKLDLGLNVGGNLCALELKHIATGSKDAKSRFLGPKSSNAVKDFEKLRNSKRFNRVLRKLLILYGPTELLHSEQCTYVANKPGSLNKICLQCAMKLFKKELFKKARIRKVDWQAHKIQNTRMYLVEVDV